MVGQSRRYQWKGQAENIPEGREGGREDGARASNWRGQGSPGSPTACNKGSAGGEGTEGQEGHGSMVTRGPSLTRV